MTWTKRWTERLRTLVRREAVEGELDEELAFHLEIETEKNLRAGMSPAEARRQAALTFGAMEKFREEVRDGRRLGWIPPLSLDFRLGVRMLVRYPGLALIGGLGMAVAIAVGAGFFVAAYSFIVPTLPLEEGDRVIGFDNWDASINNDVKPSLHDFATWKEELRSVRDLGAVRTIERNLIVPGGTVEPVMIAEMTASGFRVARVPPLMGRHLVEADEREGAPPVVVIGHRSWQKDFQSDPAVVGGEVRLGSVVHTVVGVMPERFAFPLDYRFWVPLRANPTSFRPGEAPQLTVFGRLAPGVTREQAQAELEAVGRRTASAFPETHGQLRPRIIPYTALFMAGLTRRDLHLAHFIVSLLLVVVAVNVAVLVYARTATRRGEIAVRTALGASRRRIVTQLFAEALVLTTAAAVAGLLIVRLGLGWVDARLAHFDGLPFWFDLALSPGVVLYVLGLAVVGAAIIGVVPGLQATGRRLQSSLREVAGAGGSRMGRTWTVLIIAQVALAAAVLPAAMYNGYEWLRSGYGELGFPADEFLIANLAMDQETPASAEAEGYQREFVARFGDRVTELTRRLEAEPGVADVTFSTATPGTEPITWIEVDGVPLPAGSPQNYSLAAGTREGHPVGMLRVGADFFQGYGVPLLAGRLFESGDVGPSSNAVVVNRTFVERVMGGENAVGSRFRHVGRGTGAPDDLRLGSWYEIVGVVEDFPRPPQPGLAEARLYHPVRPGAVHPVVLAVRLQGVSPAAFTGRLREIGAALDPTLQLQGIRLLEWDMLQARGILRMGALVIALVTLSVLLLSAAGIYALMSFTVTRRRREIGIRAALGAHPRRILASIFSRALGQLALGLLVGTAAAFLLEWRTAGVLMGGNAGVVLPVVAALTATVGLLAATGPARRGLSIQPTEALRED
jgi:putative ABC transport system permease protein